MTQSEMEYHQPVMLKEVNEFLQVEAGRRYIDCTLGDGGHALEILKKDGSVLGLDVNQSSLKRSTERIKNEGLDSKFTPVKGNFRNLEKIAILHGFTKVNGILFDLGYSSTQLQEEDLGLSFLQNQKLDMRLSEDLGVTAADLVNALPEKELARIFFEYSGETMSRKFAKELVRIRSLKKIQTTKDLADLLASAASPGYENGRIHPATRVFQALRIAVNDEFENLKLSLPQAARLLLPGGRMLVISFHSLEDKLVKEFGHSVRPPMRFLTPKPLEPSEDEVRENVRARSAKLRALQK